MDIYHCIIITPDLLSKQEILSFEISISEDAENQFVAGHYKLTPETFRLFFYEKLMKRVNIYKVDLRRQKVDGPQYLNIDFIQNRIDSLNQMAQVGPKSLRKPAAYGDFETQRLTKYSDLLEQFTSSPPDGNRIEKLFKIKLMTLNNYFHDLEVLLVFDGYNVYKYIEESKNE